MKQKIRLGDCYALAKYKLKYPYIRYISLLAVLTTMCLEARAQRPDEPGPVLSGIITDTSGTAITAARISIRAQGFDRDDTLVLIIWPKVVDELNLMSVPHRAILSTNKGNTYSFTVDSLHGVSRFSLGVMRETIKGRPVPIFELYMIEPGDDIKCFLNKEQGIHIPGQSLDSGEPLMEEEYSAVFRGSGSAKYTCRWEIDGIVAGSSVNQMMHRAQESRVGADRLAARIDVYRSLNERSLATLESHRLELTEDVYQLMKADVIGRFGISMLGVLNYNILARRALPEKWSRGFLDTVDRLYSQYVMPLRGIEIPVASRNRSMLYTKYFVEKLYCDREVISGGGTAEGFYHFLKDVSPAEMVDRVLVQYLFSIGTSALDQDALNRVCADAIAFMGSPLCRQLAEALNVNRKEGGDLSAFIFHDLADASVPISDFRDKVVFIDFYYNACLPCKLYFRDVVSPVWDTFKDDERVVFITVSTDSAKDFRVSVSKKESNCESFINLYTGGKGFDHPMIEALKITSYPFPVLLDQEGKLFKTGKNLRSVEGLMQEINHLLAKGNSELNRKAL